MERKELTILESIIIPSLPKLSKRELEREEIRIELEKDLKTPILAKTEK